jgi:hypothetical protein
MEVFPLLWLCCGFDSIKAVLNFLAWCVEGNLINCSYMVMPRVKKLGCGCLFVEKTVKYQRKIECYVCSVATYGHHRIENS